MWLHQWYASWRGRMARASGANNGPVFKRRAGMRLRLEQLEDRTLPSNFFADTVSDLIADINAANKAGGSNTITLTAPTSNPYVVTAVDNTTDGANGLPVIAKKDTLTIIGNGDTIERSTAPGTPAFRLFHVANGASLTLENLTLQNGRAFGPGRSAEGGAVLNKGTLIVSGGNVQGNLAQGSQGADGNLSGGKGANGGNGQDAAGGGIWSSGTLTLEAGTTITNNTAYGGTGGPTFLYNTLPGKGGMGSGGGVYIASGTASLTGCTISGNSAFGGVGGFAPDLVVGEASLGGFGGGVYIAAGVATLSNATMQNNQAVGDILDGGWSAPGPGYCGGIYIASGATVTLCNDTVQSNTATFSGGGIYVVSGATVYIDSFTVANTINNTDGSGLNSPTANFEGTYILRNC